CVTLFRPGSAVARMQPVLQFTLILLLVASLFALPEAAAGTRAMVASGSARVRVLPWVWFLGLEEVLSGRTDALLVELSRLAFTGCAAAAVLSLALHVLTFRL